MTGTPQCVLVVEDDAMIQAFLALHLESEGYSVLTAGSGGEMFRILNAGNGNADGNTDGNGGVDLILLDLNLPDGDGLSLARRVRDTSQIPIIIATARRGHEDRLTALGLGADDYLTKPFDPKELLLRVRNVLDRSRPTGKPGDRGDRSAHGARGARGAEKQILETIGSIMAGRPVAGARQANPPAPVEQTLNWTDAVDETPPPAGDRRLAFAGTAAAIAVAAGIGAFWMAGPPQPATPEMALETARETGQGTETVSATIPQPAPQPASQPARKTASQPARKTVQAQAPASKRAPKQAPAVQTGAREVSGEVTGEVIEEVAVSFPVFKPAPARTPATPEDREPKPLAEVLGYGWVLNSQCGSIPPVQWWKYTNHEDVAGYVQRKYGGDWTAYREKWLLRLAKLHDIYRRNSGAITNDGRLLKGGELAAYMEQMQKRLVVTNCLAGEAGQAQEAGQAGQAEEAEEAKQAERAGRRKRAGSRLYFRGYPKTPWRDRYRQRLAGKTG